MGAAGAVCVVFAAGCGASPAPRSYVPVPVGRGPLFMPTSLSAAVAAARPIGRLRCRAGKEPRYGVHLELFARGRVVVVPAGIGVAPPRRRSGAYVRGGRCSYPVITREPTGLLEVERGARLTLADLFRVWGQPLGERVLAGFRDRTVRAYVGGRRVRVTPAAIALVRHAEVVLEVGHYVPPHASYLFPPGL